MSYKSRASTSQGLISGGGQFGARFLIFGLSTDWRLCERPREGVEQGREPGGGAESQPAARTREGLCQDAAAPTEDQEALEEHRMHSEEAED